MFEYSAGITVIVGGVLIGFSFVLASFFIHDASPKNRCRCAEIQVIE